VVSASEISWSASRVVTVKFIRSVTTVILVIAFPALEDAATVIAAELRGAARVECWKAKEPIRIWG